MRGARRRAPGAAPRWARVRFLLLGLGAGMAVGYATWTSQQHRHSRSLFHPRPLRRLAALGYLRAHPSVDSARLLREYVCWEPQALLRRRARQVLRRMEQLLRS